MANISIKYLNSVFSQILQKIVHYIFCYIIYNLKFYFIEGMIILKYEISWI